MEKKMITIQNSDGTTFDVELITYLFNDEQTSHYIVYSKGEMSGDQGDEIIYISRIVKEGDVISIEEITDDN